MSWDFQHAHHQCHPFTLQSEQWMGPMLIFFQNVHVCIEILHGDTRCMTSWYEMVLILKDIIVINKFFTSITIIIILIMTQFFHSRQQILNPTYPTLQQNLLKMILNITKVYLNVVKFHSPYLIYTCQDHYMISTLFLEEKRLICSNPQFHCHKPMNASIY